LGFFLGTLPIQETRHVTSRPYRNADRLTATPST